MVSARDVNQSELIKKIAEELKEKMEMPNWAIAIKTGSNRERPPEDRNWWFVRSASVLRKIYVDGPVGVQRLRSYYGGLHRRGHKPARFARGSGKLLRVMLQDLEKIGYVKVAEKKGKIVVKIGRIVTKEGQKFLDGVARKVK